MKQKMKNNFNTITPEKEYNTHLTPVDEYNNSNSGGLNNWKESTLGLIPNDWKLIKADEFCLKVADGTHDSPKKSIEGRLLITSKNIKNGNLDVSSAYLISINDYHEVNKRSKVDQWDILLSMIGTVGEVCLISNKPDFAIKNVGLFKCGNEYNAKWIYYFLRSSIGQNYILSRLSGTTQKYITLNELRNFPIIIPSNIEEQKAIASVLSAFDDKIELLREQNKTLEEMGQTIFQEWFGKYSPERPEELPEGWRVGKLGEEFNITMGQSPSGESYNENNDGIIFFQGRAEFQERYPKVRLFTTEPKRIAERFDVLVSVRAPVGDINVANERCCIGRGLAALSSKYKSYMLYKIRSLKDIFNKFESEGTVFGSINKDSFSNIEVIIPKNDTILEFEKIVSLIDLKIFNNSEQIQSLSRTRDELLPRLMRGELRVGGF